MGERRDVRRRGAILCPFFRRHFAGGDAIEHPDPGGEVVPVARVKSQDAQVQTATLIFVMTFRAEMVEEFSRSFDRRLVGKRNAAQQRCSDQGAQCAATGRSGIWEGRHASHQPYQTGATRPMSCAVSSDCPTDRSPEHCGFPGRRIRRGSTCEPAGGQRIPSSYTFIYATSFQAISPEDDARCRVFKTPVELNFRYPREQKNERLGIRGCRRPENLFRRQSGSRRRALGGSV